jgi:hypothetical protein
MVGLAEKSMLNLAVWSAALLPTGRLFGRKIQKGKIVERRDKSVAEL